MERVEEWRVVPGTDGWIEASSAGNVRHGYTKRPLPLSEGDRSGSRWARLDRKHYRVRELVARAFIGPVSEEFVVRHLDGNAGNCAAENLRVVPRRWRLPSGMVLLIFMAQGSHKAIAAKYGVSRKTVREIKAELTWENFWQRALYGD